MLLTYYAGYLEIQGTKPQTISYALVDSPIGMLAWIRDKVEHLVDDDYILTEEEIVTWAMVRPPLPPLLLISLPHSASFINIQG